ncbi:MAG: type II secretion system GspH family protein, partial [Actinomycetota bacterium]|nr:type II secretion system GspH family protein [Actinomycetota bacterium]
MELMVVMAIIGILVSLVLIASANAVQTARERATQGLIAKLDAALTDRIDAILQSQTGEPTSMQKFVSPSYSAEALVDMGNGVFPPTSDRAYVLAQVELFLREVPDVFYVQDHDPSATGYPLNFAANPYPITGGSAPATYVLPLGAGASGPGQGIYGASYGVAAGLYKNLGYLPRGYDGADNNGNGAIDEWSEGTGGDADIIAKVKANLANHQHKTARAEVLYALLVESQGPFGSIFTREDFTDLEVMDTDGDGLPEFVDAWGEPLQFYRWPVFYHSDLQRGLRFTSDAAGTTTIAAPYDGMIDQREQDPLDPNQMLMAPAWWSSTYSDPSGADPLFPSSSFADGGGNSSAAVTFFENYF